MTPREYADTNNMTLPEFFFHAWREVTQHAPEHGDSKAILQDYGAYNVHGTVPKYVESFLRRAGSQS